MSKKRRFRTPFDSKHVKQSEKVHQSTSIILFHHIGKNWVGKSRFSVFELLGVFVNTLTANDKYSLRTRKNLQPPNELRLSEKQTIFSQFLAAYLKSTSTVSEFDKKRWPLKIIFFSKLETARNVVS